MQTIEYAVRLFINEERKPSDSLTKEEALIFISTAQHLIKYLKEAYINE